MLSPCNEVTDGSNSKWKQLSQQLLKRIVSESASAFWFADHILSQRCCLRAAWNPNFNFLVLGRSTSSSVIIAVASLWQVDIQPILRRRMRLVFSTLFSLLSLLTISPPLLIVSPASTTWSWKNVQKSTNLGKREIRNPLTWGERRFLVVFLKQYAS